MLAYESYQRYCETHPGMIYKVERWFSQTVGVASGRVANVTCCVITHHQAFLSDADIRSLSEALRDLESIFCKVRKVRMGNAGI